MLLFLYRHFHRSLFLFLIAFLLITCDKSPSSIAFVSQLLTSCRIFIGRNNGLTRRHSKAFLSVFLRGEVIIDYLLDTVFHLLTRPIGNDLPFKKVQLSLRFSCGLNY